MTLTTREAACAEPRPVSLQEWLGDRDLPWFGTNAGASAVPFQTWHHFKEAFAPELVATALASAGGAGRVFDPFGGSGTTALTCQFLGADVTTLEVNPFLADVIRAKLAQPDAQALRRAARRLTASARKSHDTPALPAGAPSTLIEPGTQGRFVFHREAAEQILRLSAAIGRLKDPFHQSFFKAVLGGTLVGLSNVVVNGKGRRYRRGWSERVDPGSDGVDEAFLARTYRAASDIELFAMRRSCDWTVHCGDARTFKHSEPIRLTVCSPPYPNSFDYTDVYNLELWMLGYLGERLGNRELRTSTLSSHVQVHRDFDTPPTDSTVIGVALAQFEQIRDSLWNRHIPEMVGAYFSELLGVFDNIRQATTPGGELWIVVGDSQYRGVLIRVADALSELLTTRGWELRTSERSRSMRASAQQGGQHDLSETLLVFVRP